jgi:SAM-dependent methyltransferase
MSEKKYTGIVEHYEKCFDKYGDSHLGMDWPKADDADKRYQVMLDIGKFSRTGAKDFSMLDFGCGTAHLYEYILKNKLTGIEYSGLDLSEKFVNVCRQKFPGIKFYCADLLESPDTIAAVDYLVMNGVFTEKRQLSFDEMFEYFQKLITATFAKVNVGIAFNVMSKAVDWEREDLFHMPADMLIQFLTQKLSRNFIIRNDYGLYEYTVYLYK